MNNKNFISSKLGKILLSACFTVLTFISLTNYNLTAKNVNAATPCSEPTIGEKLIDCFPSKDQTFAKYVYENILNHDKWVNKKDSYTITAEDILKIKCTTEIIISDKPHLELDGIENFCNLSKLVVNNSNLTQLPELPAKLTTLDCSNNKLSCLPHLPSCLKYLDASCNNLTYLPNLPNSLELLYVNFNKLERFPLPISSNLSVISCANNKFRAMPILPRSVDILNVSNNNLTSLTNLPEKITTLRCANNKLTNLDVSNLHLLTTLDCNNNALKQLDLSNNINLDANNSIVETQTSELIYSDPQNMLKSLCIPNNCVSNIAINKKQKFSCQNSNLYMTTEPCKISYKYYTRHPELTMNVSIILTEATQK